MANKDGVADQDLPGKVLEPNADLTDDVDELAQFGREADRSDAGGKVDDDDVAADAEAKRYQHHQSRADKAEAEAEKLRAELSKRMKYDALLGVLDRDAEAVEYLKGRLTAPATQRKPVEPPQKPDSYNEAEAYSNPDSASWKYRKEEEKYKDSLLLSLREQNALLLQEKEHEKATAEQRAAEQEQMRRFKEDVVSKGIASEDFTEFFDMVNKASTEDLIGFYNWKKSQGRGGPSAEEVYGLPIRNAGGGRRPAGKMPDSGSNIGDTFLEASKTL